MDESTWFPHGDLVPYALRHDDRVARAEVDPAVAVGELEGDRDRAGEHVEQFVAIGVHLAVVRGVAGDLGRADGEPVDALWWPARLVHEPRLAIRAADADHLARQVDPSTGLDLMRRHVSSPHAGLELASSTLFPARPPRFANRMRDAGRRTDAGRLRRWSTSSQVGRYQLDRELLAWQPMHPGLIADLDEGHYFDKSSVYAAPAPTIGRLSGVPPIEPWNGASPKLKMPPSRPTSQ